MTMAPNEHLPLGYHSRKHEQIDSCFTTLNFAHRCKTFKPNALEASAEIALRAFNEIYTLPTHISHEQYIRAMKAALCATGDFYEPGN